MKTTLENIEVLAAGLCQSLRVASGRRSQYYKNLLEEAADYAVSQTQRARCDEKDISE